MKKMRYSEEPIIAVLRKQERGMKTADVSSAHHWGRELRACGYDVRLMPPAYVKQGKTDAADANAICETVGVRPCGSWR